MWKRERDSHIFDKNFPSLVFWRQVCTVCVCVCVYVYVWMRERAHVVCWMKNPLIHQAYSIRMSKKSKSSSPWKQFSQLNEKATATYFISLEIFFKKHFTVALTLGCGVRTRGFNCHFSFLIRKHIILNHYFENNWTV